MRILLATAPMTQLNGPYPATAQLLGWLRARGHHVVQRDLSIELALALFSSAGVRRLAEATGRDLDRHARVADAVIRFLQGRDPALAYRIVGRGLLPEGPRFAVADAFVAPEGGDPLAWAFGSLGLQDRARWLATLFLEDLADLIRDAVDPRFELVRYGERLAASASSFDSMHEALLGPPTLVDRTLDALVERVLADVRPELVGVSAPFAGNAYGAFRIAGAARRHDPSVTTVLGGGWPNTELRELDDPRVFAWFDHVTYDDGELPLLRLVEGGPRVRTRSLRDGVVVLEDDPRAVAPAFEALPPLSWDGLDHAAYLAVLDTLNPMHRVWSDTRWNKLVVAHGCYWRRCSFCDVTLDYIGRFEPAAARVLVDRMEAQIAETGLTGFHLVDEAAPPARLRALAEEIVARGLQVTWWGNIRFERSFTPELCALLARSGCIAVTGGLEVGHDRLLALMEKGVTVEQVARVTRAFADAGVMVHAYLMYGFPSQTLADTVDALETVRQLFAEGCLVSAFWHRFTATVHSPVGRAPERFGVRLVEAPAPRWRFARNDVPFVDPAGVDPERVAPALEKALYNYLHGLGLEDDVRRWFTGRVPAPRVPSDLVARALDAAAG
jgi:hypothetical protein